MFENNHNNHRTHRHKTLCQWECVVGVKTWLSSMSTVRSQDQSLRKEMLEKEYWCRQKVKKSMCTLDTTGWFPNTHTHAQWHQHISINTVLIIGRYFLQAGFSKGTFRNVMGISIWHDCLKEGVICFHIPAATRKLSLFFLKIYTTLIHSGSRVLKCHILDHHSIKQHFWYPVQTD